MLSQQEQLFSGLTVAYCYWAYSLGTESWKPEEVTDSQATVLGSPGEGRAQMWDLGEVNVTATDDPSKGHLTGSEQRDGVLKG